LSGTPAWYELKDSAGKTYRCVWAKLSSKVIRPKESAGLVMCFYAPSQFGKLTGTIPLKEIAGRR